jgi:hypothetical protein
MIPHVARLMRAASVMLKNTQLAHRQFIDLEHAETCLLDHQATDRKAADRQRPDGDCAERRRAQRQRQQAGCGNGFGLLRYVARHF